jgi:hypothetical protein
MADKKTSDAYRVKQDVTLHRAIREVDTLVGGEKVYETDAQTYGAGDYVFGENISPPQRERIENGELDDFLEPCSRKEAEEAARGTDYGVFIPEHSAEREILTEYGHDVIERDEELKLRAQDAEYHAEAQAEAKKDGADERPALTAPEVPDLNSGEDIVPVKRSRPGSKSESSKSESK